MASDRRQDLIDDWCDDWAKVRRQVLGIDLESLKPRERLGALSCTLGSVKEEGEGASYSQSSQNWPEVYRGMALEVHKGFVMMSWEWRQIMDVHYVVRHEEIKVKQKAGFLGITQNDYWKRLAHLKIYLAGVLRAVPGAKNMKVASALTKSHSVVATKKSSDSLVNPFPTAMKTA
jgi:hypothetical protein